MSAGPRTNEGKARALAAELDLELEVEGGDTIGVYSYRVGKCFAATECHTTLVQHEPGGEYPTMASAWGQVLRDLKAGLEPCWMGDGDEPCNECQSSMATAKLKELLTGETK